MRKRESLGGKTVSKRLAVLGCAMHCGHVDRRAPTSPIIVFGFICKVLPASAPPLAATAPAWASFPASPPAPAPPPPMIQFQVRIAQTGSGDYFFMVSKHKRPQHPFRVISTPRGPWGFRSCREFPSLRLPWSGAANRRAGRLVGASVWPLWLILVFFCTTLSSNVLFPSPPQGLCTPHSFSLRLLPTLTFHSTTIYCALLCVW